MKKSITLAALLLAIGTSVLAAAPAKSAGHHSQDEISFVPLKSDNGFGVKIDKQVAGKSIVIIYDNEGTVLFKDLLSKGASGTKGYLINNLAYGDYTVEVFSKSQVVKKQMHIYDDGGQAKSYFFFQ
ncbi:MAG: hypothetical protein JWP78_2948 [Mucilaginibacter sp.]|jgi:hypothetical protein|nr:hypothetical protein [Mucilaginibacter sp.]